MFFSGWTRRCWSRIIFYWSKPNLVQLNITRAVILMDGSHMECWTFVFFTHLIWYTCSRVIHLKGGPRLSSEAIEAKLWPLWGRSNRLVKNKFEGRSRQLSFCFHCLKMFTFTTTTLLFLTRDWYVHLFSLAVKIAPVYESNNSV